MGTVRAMDVLADRYELGRTLGTGGNATVFEALDRVLGRRVAIKVVDAEAVGTTDPAGRERFLREARSLAGFTHPNVVTLYDAGRDGDRLYLVMEHVGGGNLAELIAREAPIEPERAVAIAGDLLAALQAAHDASIIHRDVKPANVLITEDGVVKLADFGIAKQLDDLSESLTATGVVVGTRAYLAPEQAAGGSATPTGDVWAVGIVLHELLTGRRPDPAAVPPSDSVPAWLASIIATATAVDVRERFASAADMARRLGRDLEPTRFHVPTALMPAAPTRTGSAPSTTIAGGATPAARPDERTRIATAALAPQATGSRTRRWWLPIAVVAVALFVAAIAALGGGERIESVTDPSASPSAAPTSTTAPTVAAAPPPTTVEPAEPEPVEPEAVEDPRAALDALVEQLEARGDTAGREADKLAERLAEIAERHDEALRGDDDSSKGRDKLVDLAEDTREETAKWIEQGKLDPALGRNAIDLVARLMSSIED